MITIDVGKKGVVDFMTKISYNGQQKCKKLDSFFTAEETTVEE